MTKRIAKKAPSDSHQDSSSTKPSLVLNQISNYTVIIITCILCYYNTYNCGFVFDDISAIKDNKDLRPSTSIWNIFKNDFWGTPMRKEHSHKSYRPLTVLTFRWNYWMHELHPPGYHIVNVIFHCIVCILYNHVCISIFSNISSSISSLLECSKFSMIATLLFVVHPIHTEAVTGVVGRAELLSSIFFLLSLKFYINSSRFIKETDWISLMLSITCIAFAMLSKEQGVTIAGICVIYEIFIVQNLKILSILGILQKKSLNSIQFHNQGFKRILAIIFATFLLLILRMFIMGSQLPIFTRFDNPASVEPTPVRQLTYNYLIALNLWLLLFPCDLCCDWTMGTVSLVKSIFDIRNLGTIGVYLGLSLALYKALTTTNRKQATTLTMGLAFLCLPFLPASNLFFPVGFVIAERVLYMPSMGFCILVAYGCKELMKKFGENIIKIFLTILFITHGLKTYQRNWDWQTEYTIFMSALKVNQNNAKLFNNVGHALEGEELYEEALVYFKKAVQIQNDDIGAHINVGRTYGNLKMYKDAENAYLRAKSLLPKPKPGESYQARIAPNHLNVFLNLANLISKNQSRLEEADLLYRQAISMRSDYIQAYINRGDILMKLNRTLDAQNVYEEALKYDKDNPDIHYNLGVVFLEQNKTTEALNYLNQAINLNPDHDQALLSSAILLGDLGGEENRNEARKRLTKLIKMDETNEKIYFNLGMLAMDENKTEEAEKWFKKAINVKEDFRSALFNLALLLSDIGRPLDAVQFLTQLIKYHPNHTKGLILLGDIYINNMKNLDAAETCYKKIIEIEPDNIQGLHNLCVVHVERGKLKEALNCLHKAHKMAPHEDYIFKHLQIVENRLKKNSIETT